MKAILIATGENDQLQPLTAHMPSPMAPVANRPAMEYAVDMLIQAGVKHIVFCLYRFAGEIEAHFGDGLRWGVDFDYVLQREAWGSAGALKWAAEALPGGITETCVVLPADALIMLDLQRSLEFHQAHGGIATVITHASPANGRTDPIWFVPSGPVRATTPKGALLGRPAPGYATGAYIFEPNVLEHIPARATFDCYADLLPALLKNGEAVNAWMTRGYCIRLSNLIAYHAAQAAVVMSAAEVNGPRLLSRLVSVGVWVGRNTIVHPSAKLAPPILIGDDCDVRSDVELGPNAVIGNNVIIDERATVRDSVVLDSTYIGRRTNVEHRIAHKSLLIDPATSASAQVTDRFLLSEVVAQTGGARKLIADRLIALAMWIALAPLVAVIYLVTWLTVGRPVLTREQRVGRRANDADNTPSVMNMLRFHTPDGAALDGAALDGAALDGAALDGAAPDGGQPWLSRLGWNRWPELWNVVRGDMALVGVKPLSMEEASHVKEEWQLKRYECPAGMTGLWYTQADTLADLDDTLVADAYYAATRTRREDLRLLRQTLSIWWRQVRAQSRQHVADPSHSAA